MRREVTVPSTFDVVVGIIAITCHIPRETIGLDSNLLSDLGVDSLDLLDVGFSIDDAFSITVPWDRWLHAAQMKTPAADRYFVVGELCTYIDSMTTRGER